MNVSKVFGVFFSQKNASLKAACKLLTFKGLGCWENQVDTDPNKNWLLILKNKSE